MAEAKRSQRSLRSTMTQQRLSELATLVVEFVLVHQLSFTDAVATFASRKTTTTTKLFYDHNNNQVYKTMKG